MYVGRAAAVPYLALEFLSARVAGTSSQREDRDNLV